MVGQVSEKMVTVTVRREDGWWTARGEQVRGGFEAKTLGQLMSEVEHLLPMMFDTDPDGLDIRYVYELPDSLSELVQRVRELREQVDAYTAGYRDALRESVTELARLKVSERDTAAVVGVSPQRVHQIRAHERDRLSA